MDKVVRDRLVMDAQLAMEAGEQSDIERQLDMLERDAQWSDWEDPAMGPLLVRAARIHLAVDLHSELELIGRNLAREEIDELKRVLPFSDVVHPLLAKQIGGDPDSFGALESLSVGTRPKWVQAPDGPNDLNRFRQELDAARRSGLSDPSSFFLSLAEEEIDSPVLGQSRHAGANASTNALRLAELGWKRWRIVATSLFLAEAAERLLESRKSGPDRMHLSLLGTLSLFRESGTGLIHISFGGLSLGQYLDSSLMSRSSLNPTLDQVRFTVSALQPLAPTDRDVRNVIDTLERSAKQSDSSRRESGRVEIPSVELITALRQSDASGLCLFLLSPGPLEVLAERAIDLPSSKSWG